MGAELPAMSAGAHLPSTRIQLSLLRELWLALGDKNPRLIATHARGDEAVLTDAEWIQRSETEDEGFAGGCRSNGGRGRI